MSSSAGAVAGGVAGGLSNQEIKRECLINMTSHINCDVFLNNQFNLVHILLTLLIVLAGVAVLVIAFEIGRRKPKSQKKDMEEKNEPH